MLVRTMIIAESFNVCYDLIWSDRSMSKSPLVREQYVTLPTSRLERSRCGGGTLARVADPAFAAGVR